MPLSYLIALFIGMPLVELALLIQLHEWMGLLNTVLLVFLTGSAGIYLVKRQGIGIFRKIQQEMAQGALPAPQMIDGVMILVAGALLVTPGILTDAVGFLLLIPPTRYAIRMWLKRMLEKKLRDGSIQINTRIDPPF
jgi:UPF0716 protein FxsA